MRLDNDGWMPREDRPMTQTTPGISPLYTDAAQDANQDTVDLLVKLRGFHRKSARAISDLITKAKANS